MIKFFSRFFIFAVLGICAVFWAGFLHTRSVLADGCDDMGRVLAYETACASGPGGLTSHMVISRNILGGMVFRNYTIDWMFIWQGAVAGEGTENLGDFDCPPLICPEHVFDWSAYGPESESNAWVVARAHFKYECHGTAPGDPQEFQEYEFDIFTDACMIPGNPGACVPLYGTCSAPSDCCGYNPGGNPEVYTCEAGVCSDINATYPADSVPEYTGPLINFENLVRAIFLIVLPVAVGFIGIPLIIINGYKILTSQGDPQRVQSGKEGLTSAVVGLIFVLLALSILRIMLNVLFGITI